jgi:hypothetical protein
MLMRAIAVLISLTLVASATAEPFWFEYDASLGLFPEAVGWDRLTMDGGAQRSLDDGVLTLDGLASWSIVDDYGIFHPIDLAPGELFVMQWRLRVDEVHGSGDPGVGVDSEAYGRVALLYSESSIRSIFEDVWIFFEPHVFHDYSFTSTDLLTYTLQIDGSVVYTGVYVSPSQYSSVYWGDLAMGARSLSVWDYVRFGVVPEPSTVSLALLVVLPAIRTTRRIRPALARSAAGP